MVCFNAKLLNYNISVITVDLYSFPFYFVWLIYRPTDEAGGLMGYFGKALSPSSYLPVHVSGVLEHCMYNCMYSRNAALLEPLLWRRVGALENRLDLTSERHCALLDKNTNSLFTQVYEWVPPPYCWVKPSDRLASHSGGKGRVGGEPILLLVS